MLTTARAWAAILRLATAAALVALIFAYVDWTDLARTLAAIRPTAAASAVVCFAAVSVLEAVRLQLVLTPSAPSFFAALRLQVIGSAFGNVTPAQLGGDAYRILRLGQEGRRLVPVSVRIGGLRVISLIVVMMAAAVTLLVDATALTAVLDGQAASRFASTRLSWMALWLTLVLLILGAVWACRSRGSLRRQARELSAGLSGTSVAWIVLVSLLMVALRSATIWFLCQSMNLSVSPAQALLVTCLTTLATAIPLTVAGVGIREGVLVALLTALAASYEQAVGVALLSRLIMVAQGLIGVGWWLGGERRAQPV